MIKKEIGIGFITGLLTACIGFVLCVFIFSILSKQQLGFSETITASISNDAIGSLIALGTLPNLFVFFFFLKKNTYYRARGVLLASLIAALCIAISKFG